MKLNKRVMLALLLLPVMFGCGKVDNFSHRDNTADNTMIDSAAEDISDDSYLQFLSGQEKACFEPSGDTAQFFNVTEVLTPKDNYALPEIIENIKKETEAGSDWHSELVSEKYIDLGLDGDPELLVSIGAATFNLSLVVKEVEGTLTICFVGDSGGRYETYISDSGYVSAGGFDGNSTHYLENGYIDGQGDYRFWYRLIDETVLPQENALSYNGVFIGDNMGMYLDAVAFDKDEETEIYYFAQFFEEDSQMVIEVDSSVAGNPYELLTAKLLSEGKTVISYDEAQDLIEKRREAIGLAKEIVG